MTAFGIDLGTTNSCISYVDRSGRPVVVKNAIGEPTTPSVVYFEGRDKVVVGRAAKDAALLVPDLVVQLIKREMGVPDRSLKYQRRRYTPEMISAFILRDLARSAAEETGETVRDVVITVPAYFGVAEREATRRAGEIAELNVLDVLAEPVAAALSYQDQRAAERDVLVVDLGGGTFDTTVIRIGGDETRVICTDGDQRLGGADWDARVRDHLLRSFTEQHPGLDPSADEAFMQEVAIAAETMKRELSGTQSQRRNLRFGGAVARVELSRDRLEELTADLLDRVAAITQRTIEEARRRRVRDLGEIVLVGGMTKMPAIAKRLEERFGLPIRRHEPDLAVARGAALFALTREAGAGTSAVAGRLGIDDEQAAAMMSRKVTTVVPRGFGLKVIDQNDPNFPANPNRARFYVLHLLPANTPLPTTVGPVQAATGIDNQPGVDIEVWEQKGAVESEELEHNTFVGKGSIRTLVGLPAGSTIEITFTMNETGRLTVHAVEPISGRDVSFDLQIGGMDQAAVDAARTAVARHDVSS